MFGKLVQWLIGGGIDTLSSHLSDAYKAKLAAETDSDRLIAEENIKTLSLQRDVLVAEQRRALTAWIRPAMAFPVVVFLWKILIWDTVLGLGVTPYPGQFVEYVVYTLVGAYFVTRPFERR